ncbi:MAG: DUF4097 family beta strand repeat-containing protein [Rudaea sp.]
MRLQRFHVARCGLLISVAGIAISLLGVANAAPERSISAESDGAKSLHETFAVAATARIEIENVRGSVVITGWDRAEVELGGSLGGGSKLEISSASQQLKLQVVSESSSWFGGNGPKHASDLILHVPQSARLDLHVISADAKVNGLAGASLKVAGVSGKLDIDSAAADIDVTSVSGDIALSVPTAAVTTRVHIQSVSGDIGAKGLSGRIKLETVSGNLDLTDARVQELETGSVSGDARISVALLPQARLHLESMSGDIHAQLPTILSAHIDASTFSGNVGSDYGSVANKRHGPGSSLKANLGAGDAQISVQTFSGDIELRKGAHSSSK